MEQLCIKFEDMPNITHRAIVSASGYTAPAIAKAEAHNVELYILKSWTEPIGRKFPAHKELGKIHDVLRFESNLLYWVDWTIFLHVPDGPPSFRWVPSTPIFGADGTAHKQYANMAEYSDALLLRSTELFCSPLPTYTIHCPVPPENRSDNVHLADRPPQPHTHTLDVRCDEAFLRFEDELALVTSATISGGLQLRRSSGNPEFYILEHLASREAFAGAAIADWGAPHEKMFAMVFSPETRTTGIHTIELGEKHKNAIRQLKISR